MSDITTLLNEWQNGDDKALEQLLPLVFEELKLIAKNRLKREVKHHPLQTTELVNELYLKLVKLNNVKFENRAHFYAVCIKCVRNLLTDYAREQQRQKRGGDNRLMPLEDVEIMSAQKSAELIALDGALDDLAKQSERQAKIVELRYFGGLSVDELAEFLGISERTVQREWKMAKAWLYKEMSRS